MSWELARFTKDMIDQIANNPKKYDVQDLRQAVRCAALHYRNDTYGCDIEWMQTRINACNDALRSRGESAVYDY